MVLGKLGALLKGIKINLKDLLVKEKGSIAIDIALGTIKDLGAIFGLLGEAPGNMIPNIPALAELAHGALYSLTHDENQLGDRVNTLATGLVDPDWKPGGGSTGGDGGNGNGGGSGSGNGSTGGGNGSTSGSGGSAGAITGSGKPSSGKLPQTGDTNTFAAAALMGLSALAAAIHAAMRRSIPRTPSNSRQSALRCKPRHPYRPPRQGGLSRMPRILAR